MKRLIHFCMPDSKQSILIVDDSPADLEFVSMACSGLNCEIDLADNAEDALSLYQQKQHSLVLTDYIMEPINGVDLLLDILKFDPNANCLIMSGYPDDRVVNFLRDTKLSNMIHKPIKIFHLTERLRLALNRDLGASERLDDIALVNRMDSCLPLIGVSREIRSVRVQLINLISSTKPLLIEGPKGVGKLDLARLIHGSGLFALSRYKECCCDQLSPEDFAEQIVDENRELGTYCKEMQNGTLVLGGLEYLSMEQQNALADVFPQIIQQVHLICLQETSVDDLLEQGRLSEQLYLRLNMISVVLPALQERKDDIRAIVMHILQHPFDYKISTNITSGQIHEHIRRLSLSSLDGNMKEVVARTQSAFGV